jgi:hypothetical protein
MASFCMQCSIDIFGEDHKDLAGLVSELRYRNGFLAVALCEQCGPVYVDPSGRKVNSEERPNVTATTSEDASERLDRLDNDF